MKIAIYTHSIAPSIDGVCRRFTGIIHEFVRQGHDVLLFTMESEPQDLPKGLKFVTLDYMVFPSYPNKKVAKPTLNSLNLIWSHLSTFQPELIHIVSDGFSQFFSFIAMTLRVPLVASFHTDLIDLLSTHGAYEFQKGLVITKEAIDSLVMDSCATTSKSFQVKLKQQYVNCEHVIITAVDNKLFAPDKRNEKLRQEMMFGDENGFLCVYVGRISGEKRLEVVIDAIKNLEIKDNKKAYLAIIGDGPSAKKYADYHGKENRIYCKPRFLSHPELAEIYSSSDIHISASEFETLGNTVLEAFACGIPVVVPRTQGFSDTVKHEVDGFLFAPGDWQDARRYVQLLKDDEKLKIEMGTNGRNAVQEQTIQYVVNDLFQWYQKGIQNRKSRPAVKLLLCYLLMMFFVPTTIFMFFVYDILVNVLLKPFIHYSGENPHDKKHK
mmetsp:Transcript_30561/g.33379  ORF Transcript_30561/g.33379 Transcript_30561/m.33379 type:complete len:438 (-) Transcript_30561:265-1578(-)|eukprot:CAMPEP_0173149622 /NCGR_PEP_ID=MMETSP1105-20130129/10441_1 /TAXON_ID=2985 /ORGANISM="Ochromonas sp., Strain BG-1" /LENGTH=437 /DNA_ID=CAMNT_0014064535 /DNA_START=201 /DNA_END=1514 /DNA_ORIENTATION=-